MDKVLSMPAFSKKREKHKKKVTLVEHFKDYQIESKDRQNVKIVGLDFPEPVKKVLTSRKPAEDPLEDEIMSSSDEEVNQFSQNLASNLNSESLPVKNPDLSGDLAAKLRKELYSSLHNKIVSGKLPQSQNRSTDDEIMTSSDDETITPMINSAKDKHQEESHSSKNELSNIPSTSASLVIETTESPSRKEPFQADISPVNEDIMTSSSDEDDHDSAIRTKTVDKSLILSSAVALKTDSTVTETLPDANDQFQSTPEDKILTSDEVAKVPDNVKDKSSETSDSRPATPIMDSSDDEEVSTSELLKSQSQSTEKDDSAEVKIETSDQKTVPVDTTLQTEDHSKTEPDLNLDEEPKFEVEDTKVDSDSEKVTDSKVTEESAIEIESWDAIKRQNELSRVTIENAERISSAPSQELYADAAKLLTLFGCALIFAPGEAEAQCAQLELDKVTNGTITDDSDAFLFGSRKVYRKMDLGTMTPLLYDIESIKLSRDEMIALAQLTGSDYCPGVVGIGPKTAYKILSEFSPQNTTNFFRSLEAFSSWWKLHHQTLTSGADGSKFRLKLKKLKLDADFPNSNASNAYYNPDITPNVTSLRKLGARDFPDLDGLRQFAQEKMFWSSEQFDEHIKPVLKSRIEPKKSNINFYFAKK